MVLYFIQYIVVVFLSFLASLEKKFKPIGIGIIVVLLAAVAGFRGETVGRDYATYMDSFKLVTSGRVDYFNIYRILFYEPAFFIIPNLSKLIFPHSNYLNFSFVVFAVFGVLFKVLAMQKLSNSFLLSIILYMGGIFFLHEMTQIRAGVASGILLISIGQIYTRNLKMFLLCILGACFFHYSSIIFLPLYFLSKDNINRLFWILVIAASFAIGISKINILNIFSLSDIAPKVEIYSNRAHYGTDQQFGVFTLNNLISLFFISIFLFNFKLLSTRNIYFILMLKIYILSLVCYNIFTTIPVLASRLSQLFGTVQLCLLPCSVFLISRKYIFYIIIIFISFLEFYSTLFHHKIIQPYYTWW